MTGKILIVGGGRIGQALSFALKKSKPLIWDIDPKKSSTKKPLPKVAKEAKIIFLCVPGIAHEEVLEQIKDCEKDTLIISVAKGITKTNKFVWQLLEELPLNYGILAGPIMAEEILNKKPSVGVIAFRDNSAFSLVKPLFNPPFHLISYERPKDLSVAGTLKNVYALFLGIVDGLKLGGNAKAYFLIKSLREMRILARRFKADLLAINTLAGMGDLVLTAYSPVSDNRQQGEKIVKKQKLQPCEGLRTLEFLARKVKNKDELPLLRALEDIVFKQKDAKKAILDILPR